MKTSKLAVRVVVAAGLLLASGWSAAAMSPEDRCETAKNKVAGKYAACRQTAEARAISSGNPVDYSKCDSRFQSNWEKAEDRASASAATCPDEPLDPADMQSFIETNSDAIAAALNGGPLPLDLATCNANLTTCNGDLSTCNASLSSCNSDYATCSSSLDTCNAGTATAADVLSPKTFSSSAGLGVAGTMTNVGQQNVTPGTAAVMITQGYHNGTGSVAGDQDLAPGNIKTGVNLFGVAGSVIQASGNAVAAEVLAPKTFSNAGGADTGTMTNVGQQNVTPGTAAVTISQGYHDGTGTVAGDADLLAGSIKTGVNLFGVDGSVIQASGDAVAAEVLASKAFSNAAGADTGTMTNVGQQNVTPGTAAVTIAQGYHDGTGAVDGDADLVAGNIKSGVSLFGVTGTYSLPGSLSLLKTGQTQCDTTGGGVMGACPGTPTGQDGELQKGAARSYTNNGDGTITDNVSSLMWENLCDQDPPGATCPTDHDVDTTYTWASAFAKVAAMNAANYASHSDWRLPNISEIQSLVDYSGAGVVAAIDVKFRTGCTAPCSGTACTCTQASGFYWSSTSYSPSPINAWAAYFYDGKTYANGKGVLYYVRAVRDGS